MTDTLFDIGPSEDCPHKMGLRIGPLLDVADTWECAGCGEFVAIRLRYDAENGTYASAAM